MAAIDQVFSHYERWLDQSQPHLRPADDIQHAHDRLVAVISGAPNPFPDLEEIDFAMMCDVLCWVLGHDHNSAFDAMQNVLDAHWALIGVGVTDHGELIYPVTAPQPPLLPEQYELLEHQRIERILAGIEHQCVRCGCSETKSCPNGCGWADPEKTICTRCEVEGAGDSPAT